ncbi:uncharacterized protein SOCE836_081260 [Sorangium cellulosum]|uniref:Uncharacterized protein n=1 Tax=Sorangium cellulosum TaxID=56 RepID=A0A4P2QZ95_SORCE|nr:uncharacterized protein SOCE836_081260 [Sorangium cellulosum]WCQ95224.1 hypothetical protein NQZ70_08000 [Sorangium sp. Soce836]
MFQTKGGNREDASSFSPPSSSLPVASGRRGPFPLADRRPCGLAGRLGTAGGQEVDVAFAGGASVVQVGGMRSDRIARGARGEGGARDGGAPRRSRGSRRRCARRRCTARSRRSPTWWDASRAGRDGCREARRSTAERHDARPTRHAHGGEGDASMRGRGDEDRGRARGRRTSTRTRTGTENEHEHAHEDGERARARARARGRGRRTSTRTSTRTTTARMRAAITRSRALDAPRAFTRGIDARRDDTTSRAALERLLVERAASEPAARRELARAALRVTDVAGGDAQRTDPIPSAVRRATTAAPRETGPKTRAPRALSLRRALTRSTGVGIPEHIRAGRAAPRLFKVDRVNAASTSVSLETRFYWTVGELWTAGRDRRGLRRVGRHRPRPAWSSRDHDGAGRRGGAAHPL